MTATVETLTAALLRAGRSERCIALFDRRGRPAGRRSFAELLEASRATGARLATLGVGPGEPVAIALGTSWEFLESWLGTLLLGAWPVAVAPPGGLFGASEDRLLRMERSLEVLGSRWLIATESLPTERFDARSISPQELAATAARGELAIAEPEPDSVAFLQLTSGSTGRPRAVMISQRAALQNPTAFAAALQAPHDTPMSSWDPAVVSWLPLHHDMGLVGCLLLCLVNDLELWLMPPSGFLSRPQSWLKLLSTGRVALSAGPNFAYQLCADRVSPEHLEGCDFSSWRVAMLGAEMISAETMASFLKLLEKMGFRPEALRPSYGLAEATLAVSVDQQGRGVRTQPVPEAASRGSDRAVSVGTPIDDTELEIRAPDGSALGEDRAGEVFVRGPGVFEGYYRDAAATREALLDGWLRTGDLGFLHDGELCLTGRAKDLIIVNGENVMPHELEWLAEGVSGGGGDRRCGAISVHNGGTEQAALVVELGRGDESELAALDREIRRRVGHALGLTLADVAFVKRGTIPRTTSGKVQRKELLRRYSDGELQRIQTPKEKS